MKVVIQFTLAVDSLFKVVRNNYVYFTVKVVTNMSGTYYSKFYTFLINAATFILFTFNLDSFPVHNATTDPLKNYLTIHLVLCTHQGLVYHYGRQKLEYLTFVDLLRGILR